MINLALDGGAAGLTLDFDGTVKVRHTTEFGESVFRDFTPEEWAKCLQRLVEEGPPGHDFGWALAQMQKGWEVRRRSYAPGNIDYLYYASDNIIARSIDGGPWGWQPSVQDLLANDWVLAEHRKEEPEDEACT
jgi:hypothetical protein